MAPFTATIPVRLISFALFVAIVVLAAVLRLADLPNRPMHCDEAVHAIKFGQLLEDNEYVYNPYEYHGPSLNYLTLPVAWVSHAGRLTEITETHLRVVPAIFGILLVALTCLLRRELGWPAVMVAALLTAVSPAMVFYSRYYIQEMLLVCFTFGALVAWIRYLHAAQATAAKRPATPAPDTAETVSGAIGRTADSNETSPPPAQRDSGGEGRVRGGKSLSAVRLAAHRSLKPILWLMVLGVCLAMMHTSKETCVIALFAGAVGLLATVGDMIRIGGKRLAIAAPVVLVTAACVSSLFFSSFGRNPQGPYDSVATYGSYLGRAAGEGSAGEHVHSRDYYFRLLFWWQRETAPLWSEGMVAVLALVGLAAGLIGRGLGRPSTESDRPPRVNVVRMIAIYTVVNTLVYMSLPYKTPWCALGFLHGMILLAGIGAAVLVRQTPGYLFKGAVIMALGVATSHLAMQAYRASFVAYEHRHNPYVYSHTTNDIYPFVERIRNVAGAHPDGQAMHIQVICPDADFWPLPWYLRDFPHVGWFSDEPRSKSGQPLPAAPLIIAQPQMQDIVMEYNYHKQPPGERRLIVELPRKDDGGRWQFRPFVPITAFLRRDLWLDYQARQAEPKSTENASSP